MRRPKCQGAASHPPTALQRSALLPLERRALREAAQAKWDEGPLGVWWEAGVG